jgi:hypothetical protein
MSEQPRQPDCAQRQHRALPECIARIDVDRAKGLYFCAHPNVASKHNLVTFQNCLICKVVHDGPPSRLLPFRLPGVYTSSGPCKYFGEFISLRECQSCRGYVQVKIFECLHPNHKTTAIKECKDCSDYESDEDSAPLPVRGNVERGMK